ncbi:hypothetical protein ABIC16_002261 [Sphingomonas sp. PvP055]|uniref:hypothetical protein n=1 Tax=Sphingomonas sp. PvP055 TaxID=3156391 RepID=UPI00339674F9
MSALNRDHLERVRAHAQLGEGVLDLIGQALHRGTLCARLSGDALLAIAEQPRCRACLLKLDLDPLKRTGFARQFVGVVLSFQRRRARRLDVEAGLLRQNTLALRGTFRGVGDQARGNCLLLSSGSRRARVRGTDVEAAGDGWRDDRLCRQLLDVAEARLERPLGLRRGILCQIRERAEALAHAADRAFDVLRHLGGTLLKSV